LSGRNEIDDLLVEQGNLKGKEDVFSRITAIVVIPTIVILRF